MNTHLITWMAGAMCLLAVACSSPFTDAEIPDTLSPTCTPIADFESTSQCTETCIVNFTNRSEKAESFNWDFGDGNTSNEENPSHTYDKPGEYEVSLLVTCGISEDSISSVLELEPAGWFCGQPFIDERDGNTYATIWMDVDGGHDLNKEGKCWFAENLKYKPPGTFSNCYNLEFNNCLKYGSLYSAFGSQEAIPNGWRLPDMEDWQQLFDAFNTTKFLFPGGVQYNGTLGIFMEGGESGFALRHGGAHVEFPDPADINNTLFQYEGLDVYSMFWVKGVQDQLGQLRWNAAEAVLTTASAPNASYSVRAIKD
ncbi:MAG: PKD domain-containing protein [Saprospiraceae bacterium]|nr:PKD domain-containing protein [Saprospiraceae bacterium]